MGKTYSFNEKFFANWNKEMAYVLGYIYADGSLESAPLIRASYLRITSIDLERIKAIRKLLKSKHTIVKMRPEVGKIRYMLRIGSKNLYATLLRYGLRPKKSLTVEMPEIPSQYLSGFVRGYFDGDGCVFIETAKGKRKRKILKRMQIIFTSGSRKFLEQLEQRLCRVLSLKIRKITVAKRSYQLRYNTGDTVEIFKFMYHAAAYNTCMKRKVKKFQEYFQLQPERIDSEVKYVLECLNSR